MPAIAGMTLRSHLFKAEAEYRITTEAEQKKNGILSDYEYRGHL